MAIGTYTLPICDGCKLPWLPVGWKQDSDPRNLPAGAKPLRCGKCKTIGWDREHTKKSHQGSVGEAATPSVSKTESDGSSPSTPAILKMARTRCKHRMANCPICHKEAA